MGLDPYDSPPKTNIFVVHYRDGSRAFMRVPPRLAMFGASPPVLQLAREHQSTGALPGGEIEKLDGSKNLPSSASDRCQAFGMVRPDLRQSGAFRGFSKCPA